MLKLLIRFIAVTLPTSLIFLYALGAQAKPQETYFNAERIAKIENYVNQGMADERIPGVAVALIESGKVTYINGFGVADGNGTQVTPQTPFQIASMTKSFSAVLILQLEQDGKLSLDDLVINHVPWFTTANKEQSDRITIRHLLQHNSGLTTKSGNYTQNSTYRGADATRLSVKQLSSSQLSAEPGTSWEYSNSNYHIVSHIVEVIEGKPFEQVMAERVLQPLDMQNSYIQIATHKTEKEATGFPQWFGLPIERSFILGRMKMGDGGMVASAEDLTKYLLEIAQGQSGVVSKEMRDKLLNPKHNSNKAYALGWRMSKLQDQVLFEHDGTNGGFSGLFGFSDATEQRDDIAFVILTNYSSALNNQFIMNLKRVISNHEALPSKKNVPNLINLIMLYSTVLLFIFFLYRAIKNKNRAGLSVKSFIVPSLLITYSYGMAYILPGMQKINLLSIYPFFPDLAIGMFLCAGLSLLLALIMVLKKLGIFGQKI